MLEFLVAYEGAIQKSYTHAPRSDERSSEITKEDEAHSREVLTAGRTMILLCSDLTDSKGRRASVGWLFYDADCPFCVRIVQRSAPILLPRGFALAPLQDPRVADLLGVPEAEVLGEMRLITVEGKQYGGADAAVFIASKIWWAWPFYAAAQIPGVKPILRCVYRRIAAQRNCAAGVSANLTSNSSDTAKDQSNRSGVREL